MPETERLRRIAERGFPAIVTSTATVGNKLRLELVDGAYIDFWWSGQFAGRYAYHCERSHVDGTIYRHDNIPHLRWRTVSTFPKHFHAGDRFTVTDSHISDDLGACPRISSERRKASFADHFRDQLALVYPYSEWLTLLKTIIV